jgi:hypothetical protein
MWVACGDVPVEPDAAPDAENAPAEAVGGAPTGGAAVGPDGPSHLEVPDLGAPSDDPEMIARGEEVFAAKGCGGCHAFGSKLVGPDLTSVTDRRSVPWVTRMIRHPDAMTKEDPVAKDLFRAHMVQMPNQGVTDDELGPLLAFLHSRH